MPNKRSSRRSCLRFAPASPRLSLGVRPERVKLPTLITQQRIGFFAAGLLFSLATFYIGFRWPEIYERVFHEGFNYASQPTWYRIAGAIIGYLAPSVSRLWRFCA